MTTLYGIKNCDTVRKARRWLDENGVEYQFHDFRADGLTKKQASDWLKEIDWTVLINRRGTTWRKLPEATRTAIDAASALELMLENPVIIKRPVLDTGSSRHVGFSVDNYSQLFGNNT